MKFQFGTSSWKALKVTICDFKRKRREQRAVNVDAKEKKEVMIQENERLRLETEEE